MGPLDQKPLEDKEDQGEETELSLITVDEFYDLLMEQQEQM